MVDDILLTAEEQDERAKKWLKDNGLALVLGVGLGLGGIFGYQTWQAKIKNDAESASAIYSQVLAAVQNSELADIASSVEQLKSDYAGSPYAVKASLLRAKQLAVSDLDAAHDELSWASGHAKEAGLKHAALLRQAKVLFAQGNLEEAKAIALQNSDDDFSSSYQELLGDIAVREKDFSAAKDFYQASLDGLSPQASNYGAILTLKINRLPVSSSSPADASSEISDEAAEPEASQAEAIVE